MATPAKRATIYLDPYIHKALKLKAIETSRSVSDLVNQAVREALAEDAEDLAAFEQRADDPLVSYDEMVRRLKKDGRI
ncbi:MAG: CopG family transcriptional regulator [Desulfobacterales bacterium]|jgi:ABC-type transporter Mla subunit MlaD